MNKKGDFTGLLFLIISIAVFAIFLIIITYVYMQVVPPIKEQLGVREEINNTFDMGISTVQNTLPAIWLVMFAGLMIGLMITAWFIPTHPVFFPIFAILMVAAIIVGMGLSNAYEALNANAELASTAGNLGMVAFLMSHLPVVAFIIGLAVMIISFAKPRGESAALA